MRDALLTLAAVVFVTLPGAIFAAEATRPPTPAAEHVLLVSCDGLSAVYLQQFMQQDPDAFPNFRRLLSEGAGTLNARTDYFVTETVPNHTSMILGRPVLQPAGWPNTAHHGYVNNYITTGQTYHRNGNLNVPYFVSAFDVAHDRGLATAFFAGKSKLGIMYQSYNATNGAPDLIGEDNGTNKVDYAYMLDFWYNYQTCTNILMAVTNYLTTNAPHFTFVHFADLDYIGHGYYWGSPTWSNALVGMDACLGGLLDAIKAHPVMKDKTTLILTADHGGGVTPDTHVYPEHRLNYTIPFIVWGPGWKAGEDLYRLMANRFDPGTNRLDFNAPLQPIRNGDAGNLAMAMLGLPSIPGSSLLPQYGQPAINLSSTASPEGVSINWPGPAVGFELEVADRIVPAPNWQRVNSGIAQNAEGTGNFYQIPVNLAVPMQWFRLRLK